MSFFVLELAFLGLTFSIEKESGRGSFEGPELDVFRIGDFGKVLFCGIVFAQVYECVC